MLYIKLKINNCEVNNKFKIERSGIYLLSVSVLVQGILNYYPNYPTHRLYFGEVETPYITRKNVSLTHISILQKNA